MSFNRLKCPISVPLIFHRIHFLVRKSVGTLFFGWLLDDFHFFCSYFLHFSTTNHREPLHEITAPLQNNVVKRQKKCLGRCISRGCDWLVMKTVKLKPQCLRFECPHCRTWWLSYTCYIHIHTYIPYWTLPCGDYQRLSAQQLLKI